MTVKWRERERKRGRKERWKEEGVGWHRGNENERVGDGREIDREHKGGREMVSAGRGKG